MAKLPCYHVDATDGDTYGVAATTVRDALQMVQDRLIDYGNPSARPIKAQRVATWDAQYGTVLCYGPTL